MPRTLSQRASRSPSTARHLPLAATAAVSLAWAPRRRSPRPCCCQPWRTSKRYPFAPKSHSVACLVQEMCKGKSTCTWMCIVHGTNPIGCAFTLIVWVVVWGVVCQKSKNFVGFMVLSEKRPFFVANWQKYVLCSLFF